MIAGQQNAFGHSMSLRPSYMLLHETLSIELAGIMNFTTKEYLVRPKLIYDFADALSFTIGGEFYTGPEGTLYNAIKDALSAIYFEMKAAF